MDRGFQHIRRCANLDPGDLQAQVRVVAAELRNGQRSGPLQVSAWQQRLAKLSEQDRFDAITELAKLGPAAAGVTPLFIEVLSKIFEPDAESSDSQLQRPLLNRALKALHHLGSGSVTALLLGLDTTSEAVKTILLQALRKVLSPEQAKPETIQVISRCLDSENSKTRYNAAELLRSLGPTAQSALPSLCFRLRDEDRNVRVTALLAIRKIGPNPNCLPMLTRSLKDQDPLVRFWAAKITGQLGADAVEARSALYRLLLDDDHQPRKAALAALNKINRDLA